MTQLFLNNEASVLDNPNGHSERKQKKGADRRRGGKTILKSGQE